MILPHEKKGVDNLPGFRQPDPPKVLRTGDRHNCNRAIPPLPGWSRPRDLAFLP